MSSVSNEVHASLRPVSNKVRVQQLETELVNRDDRIASLEYYNQVKGRDIEVLRTRLNDVQQLRRQDADAAQRVHERDQATINELRTKVAGLETQMVSISSILNAAKTLVVNSLPEKQSAMPSPADLLRMLKL